MSKYRAFIAIQMKMECLVKLVEILENKGILPLWDKNLSFGSWFPEPSKISLHLPTFYYFKTESSNQRGWVHQEIGYAMALNLPVEPITSFIWYYF